MLVGLTAVGALAFGGVAFADDHDDDGGNSGYNHDGADGRPGNATTHCKKKFNLNLPNPMQCQEDESPGGNAQGASGQNGTSGPNGEDGDDGRDDKTTSTAGRGDD